MKPIEQFVEALSSAGWTIRSAEPAFGRAPNPTLVVLSRGRRHISLLTYAWRITGEGKGRLGTNYRIQTTRAHEGDLLIKDGGITLGVGVDNERNVFAAFDGWTKRATGTSSSVHIERATLERAAADGYSEQLPRWDARAAARVDEVGRLLAWAVRQDGPREAAVQALEFDVTGRSAVVVADLWNAAPAAWLRPGDTLAIADREGRALAEDSIWRIMDLRVQADAASSRYARKKLIFNCRRLGVVKDPASVLAGLTRRPAG